MRRLPVEVRLRKRGVGLWLVALNPDARGRVQRASLGATLGPERLLFNLQAAVEGLVSRGSAREQG
jgi:sulfate permease, SulP family